LSITKTFLSSNKIFIFIVPPAGIEPAITA
jgi:hypothetical protein